MEKGIVADDKMNENELYRFECVDCKLHTSPNRRTNTHISNVHTRKPFPNTDTSFVQLLIENKLSQCFVC